jgi:D-alanyl-D-alanine carboxypeptidase (penicillin-binding protein 5/6)
MKKILIAFFLFFVPLIFVKAIELPVDVTADSAILVIKENNEIMYSKNIDKPEIMASLTKIMTAYTVINHVGDLNERITVNENDLRGLEGFTVAGLQVGDRVTYRDLLYALILHSGADAAQTLALHVGGSKEHFNEMMAADLNELGLKNTHFVDSYGGSDYNVSTSREMYLLLDAALQNETFKKIFCTNKYTLSNGLQVTNYTYVFAQFHGYDPKYILGNKSGYTPEAGLLLASLIKVNGVEYILIVCNSKENSSKTTHVLDTYKIINYLIDQDYEYKTVLKKGHILEEIPVKDSTTSTYLAIVDQDVKVYLNNDEASRIVVEKHLVKELDSNAQRGDPLGYVDVILDGEVLKTYYLYLNDELFQYQQRSHMIVLVIVLLVIFMIMILLLNILMYQKKK